MMGGNDEERFAKEQSRMEAEQAKRDAQQVKMDAQRIKMMATQAKTMAKGLSKTITRFKTQLTTLSKRGLSVSSDCKTALDDANGLVAKLQNSTSFSAEDDGGDLFSSMPEVSSMISECSGVVTQLLPLPNIMKTIQSMMTKLEKGGGDMETVKPEFDKIMSDYAAVKNGTASSEDLESLFADMETLRADMESAFMDADIVLPSVFRSIKIPQPQQQGGMPGGMQGGPQGGMQGGMQNGPQMMQQGGGQNMMPNNPGTQGKQSNATEITPAQRAQLGSIYEALLGLKKLFQ